MSEDPHPHGVIATVSFAPEGSIYEQDSNERLRPFTYGMASIGEH
jgi:redox-sensitive bicupin YhaK (pirin superfamily)